MGDVIWVWEPMACEWLRKPNDDETVGVCRLLGHLFVRGSTKVGPPDDGPNGEPIGGVTRARCEDCGDTLPYGDRGVCDFCVAR